jgi:hypothetical protein
VDFISAFKSELFRPLVTLLIPGGVPKCLVARVESAARVEFTVPQELDFGASGLDVVPEFTCDVPAVSL